MVVLDKECMILDKGEYKIPVGNYEYPFQVFLPADIPPSVYTKSKCNDNKQCYLAKRLYLFLRD